MHLYINYYKKFLLFFFTVSKNEQNEYKFWQQKIEKSEFYENKKRFSIDDIDVHKILVSKKEPYGINKTFKYLIGYIIGYILLDHYI